MQFNNSLPYEVVFKGGYKETSTLIFCDYTRSVDIIQRGVTFPARIGYVGRDKKKTVAKYLFVLDRVYYLEDPDIVSPDYFNPEKVGFPSWLLF